MDDGFWNIEIREMALGLSSIFDRLVGKDPPDDWVRYHLTLVSALGSTAENVDLVVTSLNALDFQTFTTALGVSVQALERLQETLQGVRNAGPGRRAAHADAGVAVDRMSRRVDGSEV